MERIHDAEDFYMRHMLKIVNRMDTFNPLAAKAELTRRGPLSWMAAAWSQYASRETNPEYTRTGDVPQILGCGDLSLAYVPNPEYTRIVERFSVSECKMMPLTFMAKAEYTRDALTFPFLGARVNSGAVHNYNHFDKTA